MLFNAPQSNLTGFENFRKSSNFQKCVVQTKMEEYRSCRKRLHVLRKAAQKRRGESPFRLKKAAFFSVVILAQNWRNFLLVVQRNFGECRPFFIKYIVRYFHVKGAWGIVLRFFTHIHLCSICSTIRNNVQYDLV